MNYGERFNFPMMDFDSFKVQPLSNDPMFNNDRDYTHDSPGNIIFEHNVGKMFNDPSMNNVILTERYGFDKKDEGFQIPILKQDTFPFLHPTERHPEEKVRHVFGDNHHIHMFEKKKDW